MVAASFLVEIELDPARPAPRLKPKIIMIFSENADRSK
jgi:hypothetical protein